MTVTFPADVFMPPGTMCGGTYAQQFDLGTNAGGFGTTPTPAYSGPITGTNTNDSTVLSVGALTTAGDYSVEFKAEWAFGSFSITKEGPSSETFTFTVRVESVE